MLLWAGWILIALGIAALPLDRRIAHFFYDHISQANHRWLNGVTHAAKAGHWLGAAILALSASDAVLYRRAWPLALPPLLTGFAAILVLLARA